MRVCGVFRKRKANASKKVRLDREVLSITISSKIFINQVLLDEGMEG